MPLPNLTDDDKAILIELLRETIERDRYPLSPRVQRLRAILGKVQPAPARPEQRPAASGRRACSTR